jgi:hypothetical protein
MACPPAELEPDAHIAPAQSDGLEPFAPAHRIDSRLAIGESDSATNPAGGKYVPVRHFNGLGRAECLALAEKLRGAVERVLLESQVQVEGGFGELATMLIRDPSGNAPEFKSFPAPNRLFATNLLPAAAAIARPLGKVIFEIAGPLLRYGPAANRNSRFVHRIRIARYKMMPPHKIVAFGD